MDHQKSDSNKQALNRSYSFSGSPITQKVCVEQSFQNKEGETLIRQYSCEQIYDRSTRNPTVQFKESVFLHSPRKSRNSVIPSLEAIPTSSSLFNASQLEKFPFASRTKNLFHFHKDCPEQEGFEQSLMHNRSIGEKIQECTPMDVDTSVEDHSMPDVHSPYKMEGENDVSDNEHKSKVSKMTIPPNNIGMNIRDSQKSYSQIFVKCIKLSAVLIIPIAFALALIQTDIFISEDTNISDNFQSENITNALQDLVYGQQKVIAKIKQSFSHVDDSHVLVFTGGIGVGKTYSVNIISQNFQWRDNIIKIVSPQHKNIYHENKFIKSLSMQGYNLVIVDNLEIDDKQSVIPFVKSMFTTDKKVIIILIYTIPELSLDMSQELDLSSSSNKISMSLSEANIKHSLVEFNKLDVDAVKKCIHYAMAKKGLIINQHNIENVLQNINYEYSGCKGVYTKVALLR